MTRLDQIRQRLDACSVGTIRGRGEAEMRFHEHAMDDVEWLLTAIQTALDEFDALRDALDSTTKGPAE